MAEENQQNANVESSDRGGLFDFMKKKKEGDHEKEEEVIATEFEHKVEVPKEDKEKKEGGLLHKLHRSDSSSSSSSDEEGDDEEKKKRRKERKEKKGLKEKIKEKFPDHHADTHVPVEKIHVEEVVYSEPSHPTPIPQPAHHHDEVAPDEKKGLLSKIKDKLPGQHKKADEDLHHAEVAVPTSTTATVDVEGHEKKGFLEKIKEKVPGFHPKPSEEEKKEVEKI